MPSLFLHMTDAENYNYIKYKLIEYVKSGECPPINYASMVDRHNLQVSKEQILYGEYMYENTKLDTVQINKNRKSIGLPSLKHEKKIQDDYFKE